MITIDEILKSRVKRLLLSKKSRRNLDTLLYRINILRYHYNSPMKVTSGFRSAAYNVKIGGSRNSWHCKCGAIDLADADGEMWGWIMNNIQLLEKIGLWLEDKNDTPTWVHFQIYPPRSGNRIFGK